VDILITVLVLVLLAVVILVISAPLRAARRPLGIDPADDLAEDPLEETAELEAAREAKYREIRDVELDYRTGKLSEEDFAATDGALRAEAIEILDRLAALGREAPDEAPDEAPGEAPMKRLAKLRGILNLRGP
jgi:hypothetical protein